MRLAALPPDEARQHGADTPEKCQPGGQQKYGEGKQPGKRLRFHEEGAADPPKAGEEIAETEPPAEGETVPHPCADALLRLGGNAVHQPCEGGDGEEEDRKKVERRHGKGRHRA